jgi:C1A family cysteine protease
MGNVLFQISQLPSPPADTQFVQLDEEEYLEESSSSVVPEQALPSDKTLEQRGNSFHNQSHTVLIIGWGYDEKDNTKYWIVRNSYGPKWGQSGDFYVERGVDAFGFETNLVSYEPELCSAMSTSDCITSSVAH